MRGIRILLILFALLALGSNARAQVTSLTLNSDPGDFIGGGQFTFLTSRMVHSALNKTLIKAFRYPFSGSPASFGSWILLRRTANSLASGLTRAPHAFLFRHRLNRD
jgi:hypothetical protein